MYKYEDTPSLDAIEKFDAFREGEAARYANLAEVLARNMPIASDIPSANALFIEEGSPELVITRQVAPKPITMKDAHNGDNFSGYFQMFTDSIPPDEDQGRYFSTPVSITEAELNSVLDKQITPKELGLEYTHLTRPAYLRMGIIDRDFTVDLTLTASHPDNHHRIREYVPELFVALSIMSRLVDESDPERRYGVAEQTRPLYNQG